MATIRYNQNGTTYSCWSSTDRVTSPSLCFNDGGTTKYVPLFAVGNGSEGSSGNYYFKVGGLCAKHNGTTYRAALSRRYASSVSSSISTTITHSGKTGSTTQTVQQAKTVSVACGFGTSYPLVASQTWNYGITFNANPSIRNPQTGYCSVSAGKSSATISPTATWVSLIAAGASWASWTVSATGNISVQQTVTTYPSETKSATASGNFNYGVTYPSAPSLTVNSGGVSASNNSGNASFRASKSLSGTVAYGKSATLSQSFKVSFNGSI